MQTARNVREREVQTARNVRGKGSADCKKYYDSVRTVILFNFSISLEPQ